MRTGFLPRLVCVVLMMLPNSARSDDPVDGRRLVENQRFMALANQPTGLIVPLYQYPANIHRNVAFNRLMDLKKAHPTVPVCVIVNPANGPGAEALDPNYVKAIDRFHGAGIVTLGYVSTHFAQVPLEQVLKNIALWKTRSLRINGIFLDEMTNDDVAAHVDYYVRATQTARDAGFWPIFSNPGTPTPEPYFKRPAADVIIIHENETFPTEEMLRGDYFGGYADYPPSTRAVLVHSFKAFDRAKFTMTRKYVRWIYVTHDRFDSKADPNDPKNNPWDELSLHLETMFDELSRPAK